MSEHPALWIDKAVNCLFLVVVQIPDPDKHKDFVEPGFHIGTSGMIVDVAQRKAIAIAALSFELTILGGIHHIEGRAGVIAIRVDQQFIHLFAMVAVAVVKHYQSRKDHATDAQNDKLPQLPLGLVWRRCLSVARRCV